VLRPLMFHLPGDGNKAANNSTPHILRQSAGSSPAAQHQTAQTVFSFGGTPFLPPSPGFEPLRQNTDAPRASIIASVMIL